MVEIRSLHFYYIPQCELCKTNQYSKYNTCLPKTKANSQNKTIAIYLASKKCRGIINSYTKNIWKLRILQLFT